MLIVVDVNLGEACIVREVFGLLDEKERSLVARWEEEILRVYIVMRMRLSR